VTDLSAALTYYGILSLFPGLFVALAILGVIGPSATQPLIDGIKEFAPGPTREVVLGALKNIQSDRPTAGVVLLIAIVIGVWSASGYLKCFTRASNHIYGVREKRSFWKRGLVQLAITFGFLMGLSLVAISVAFSGPFADRLGQGLGIGGVVIDIVDFAKWPIIALIVIITFELFYHISPSIGSRKFRWISPGGIVALLLWVIASAGFAFYVSNFSHYNKTYGSIAGVVVFLIWLWLSNLAFLIGLVLNAEIESSTSARELGIE
jgi:membrane protein